MKTIASLSSGYGGLEMGLRLAGFDWPTLWHSEIDEHASQVLKTWWPEVPNLGSFAAPDFWEHAPRASMHVGGIPCQPFSAAGRQRGTEDERHLWPFWCTGIELHRPGAVLFENVANLTRGKMRPVFDGICTDLAALGYDVRWCLLGACAVGAAHHRHRVFLLARRSAAPDVREVKVQTCGQHAAAYLPTPSAVSYGSNQGGAAGRTGEVRHSLESMARLELLPTVTARDANTRGDVEYQVRRAEAGRTAGVALGTAVALLPSPRAIDAVRGPAAVDRNEMLGRKNGPDLAQAVQPGMWGKYAAAIARHEAVLGRSAPEPTEIGPKGGRRLAAAFSEWLMMLPEGHLTSVLDRNPALARAGNGVVPLQAATAIRLLLSES